jgi:hypothetical protein
VIALVLADKQAQDLGLHRESHLRAHTPKDLAYVELRRRIWATCVIMDRWYGAALGIPLQVDLLDCDVLLPAGYDVIVDQPPSTWPIEPSFVALSEHLKLSILIGRVLKTIYSPTGLKHATDEQLYSILEDMRAWKEELPEGLRFIGHQSSFASGKSSLVRWLIYRTASYGLHYASFSIMAPVHAYHLYLPAAHSLRPRDDALVRDGGMGY